MLTPDQIAKRNGKLTSSRIKIVMDQVPEKLHQLWLEMTGQAQPENLDDNFQVQMGIVTEPLNLRWYAKKNHPVTRCGEVVVHPFYPWAACTLDGWDNELACPVEAKCCGGREPFEVVAERYQPQMQWQMEVTGADQCALSVIFGNDDPRVDYFDRDAAYADKALHLGAAFMLCVMSKTPPVAIEPVAPPVETSKIYDMTGNNQWAAMAGVWIDNRMAADYARDAEKVLKSLMPDDAGKCFGHGVQITRNRAGAKSLRVQT